MRKIWNKGHRIRASDKHLVYHFSIGTLLFVFVAVLLLLNMKQLMRTDWEHFSLLENGLTLSPYNFIPLIFQYHSCQLLTVQELLETVVTEAVVQKSDQCTNTSRYQYSYEVVRGERQAVF